MARLIAFDWESDDLGLVEAEVNGGNVRIRRCARYTWPDEQGARASADVLGPWLKEQLPKDRQSADEAVVVLPRESVVFRRLDLPDVPDDELPDLVRFQAATKSSTPLDKLALDFLPLPRREGVAGRQVLMVTVDRARIETLKTTLAAAGLELKGVGISPVAMAELVTRIDGEHSADPRAATLVIFQDVRRVEITILQQGEVIFSHETRLEADQDDRGLRASLAEVNRSTVSLSHSHPNVEITEVCLVHSGDADPAFEAALQTRFGGRLHVLNIQQARGLRVEPGGETARLQSFAPAVGMLLSHADSHVPPVDFLNPRRAIVAPNRTKLRLGLVAAGVLLAGGIGYSMLRSHINSLQREAADYRRQTEDLTLKIRGGAPDLAIARQIGAWSDESRDPLVLMSDLREVSPAGDRRYLKEFRMSPALGNVITHLSGVGHARDTRDVEELYHALDKSGYRVQPALTKRSPNPDYPVAYELSVDILPAPKPSPLAGALAKAGSANGPPPKTADDKQQAGLID